MDKRGEKKITVFVLLGPTASGKTKLLSQLDEKHYEIVSCDSRQIYKGLELVTAAPPLKLQKKLPHHLVSFLEPTETFTAGRFARLAKQAFQQIVDRNKRPVLVGGSGFYYRALSTPMFPVETSPEVRKKVEAMTKAERLQLLKEIDPQALVSNSHETKRNGYIHPNDSYRIFRALEICLSSHQKWSSLRKQTHNTSHSFTESNFLFDGLWLDASEGDYTEALVQRTQEMIQAGVVAEVGQVYEKYGPCPGLGSLGCKEVLEVYHGKDSDAGLAEKLYKLHRHYAKKQRTWLRKEKQLQAIARENFSEHWSLLEAKHKLSQDTREASL